jgi:F0F1-type ATP synthase assembly protein I
MQLYRMGTMGYELVLAIVVTGGVGWLLDWAFGTKPWLLVAGMLIGIVAGLYRFMREAGAALRQGGSSDDGDKADRR